MCGRVVCRSSLETFGQVLDAAIQPGLEAAYQPSYNIPPSQPLPIVCNLKDLIHQGQQTQRILSLAQWGLLPHWAKDPSLAFKTFNARSETLQEKPAFRGAFKYRRCLIPVDGYYEWHRSGKTKQPYYFHRSDRQVLVLAGLFELWREELLTCTVITTAANTMASEIHPRMPVVLEQENWQRWLEGTPSDAYRLLHSVADDVLSKYSVGDRVNNARNNDAELLKPLNTNS